MKTSYVPAKGSKVVVFKTQNHRQVMTDVIDQNVNIFRVYFYAIYQKPIKRPIDFGRMKPEMLTC